MSWRALTEEDLVAFLSQREVDAFRQSSDFSADVIASILAAAGEFVRGHVRAGGVAVSPATSPAIPASLIAPALDYAVFDVLKRLRLAVNEDRREARRQAIALFERVADGKMAVEPETETEEDGDGGAPAVAPAHGRVPPPHLLD